MSNQKTSEIWHMIILKNVFIDEVLSFYTKQM